MLQELLILLLIQPSLLPKKQFTLDRAFCQQHEYYLLYIIYTDGCVCLSTHLLFLRPFSVKLNKVPRRRGRSRAIMFEGIAPAN